MQIYKCLYTIYSLYMFYFQAVYIQFYLVRVRTYTYITEDCVSNYVWPQITQMRIPIANSVKSELITKIDTSNITSI